MRHLEQVLAVVFGLGNATSMFLAIRGIPWGWLVVIISQSSNLTYLALTDQWLVWLGGQPLCVLLGIYGLWRWRRQGVYRAPADPRPARASSSSVRKGHRHA